MSRFTFDFWTEILRCSDLCVCARQTIKQDYRCLVFPRALASLESLFLDYLLLENPLNPVYHPHPARLCALTLKASSFSLPCSRSALSPAEPPEQLGGCV